MQMIGHVVHNCAFLFDFAVRPNPVVSQLVTKMDGG